MLLTKQEPVKFTGQHSRPSNAIQQSWTVFLGEVWCEKSPPHLRRKRGKGVGEVPRAFCHIRQIAFSMRGSNDARLEDPPSWKTFHSWRTKSFVPSVWWCPHVCHQPEKNTKAIQKTGLKRFHMWSPLYWRAEKKTICLRILWPSPRVYTHRVQLKTHGQNRASQTSKETNMAMNKIYQNLTFNRKYISK